MIDYLMSRLNAIIQKHQHLLCEIYYLFFFSINLNTYLEEEKRNIFYEKT